MRRTKHRGTKRFLQVLGVVLVVVGGTMSIIGIADFFASVGSPEPPDRFWMAFVGFPITSAGIWICLIAFMREVTRYSAGELAPVARDAMRYLGIGKSSVECPSCGAGNDPGARFCDSCERR